MTQIALYQARLEDRFQKMVSADPYDGLTIRFCMSDIMLCCHELRISLVEYLVKRFAEHFKAESPVPGLNGKKADWVELDGTREYLCRDCGQGFPTKQARAGHRAHCKQKGGTLG